MKSSPDKTPIETILFPRIGFFGKQTNDTLNQLIRYFFVSGLAFVVDFGSLYVFTSFFGVYYLISAPMAFIIGLITNYTLSVIWVFDKRKLNNQWAEFGIFALIGIIGLCINELIMWTFTEYGHLNYLISKLISAVFVFFYNFFGRKFTLFN